MCSNEGDCGMSPTEVQRSNFRAWVALMKPEVVADTLERLAGRNRDLEAITVTYSVLAAAALEMVAEITRRNRQLGDENRDLREQVQELMCERQAGRAA